MSLGEFELIERFFMRPAGAGPRHAAVGNGDDCAILAPRAGMQWAVSTDTLVEGRHFLSTVPPRRLGHKALAVNLSDLAACGAEPRAFTLALTLPRVDAPWLSEFAQGMLALADAHGCELVGGDTTSGPLSVCITVMGEVPTGGALLRSAARAGDDLWVSGWPGEARLALEAFRGTLAMSTPLSVDAWSAVRERLEAPEPRVALGLALRGVARAAIDVSDGLLGDLGHVLRRSHVGAAIVIDALPVSPWLADRPEAERLDCILAGGDDYELLFTAPPTQREAVAAIGERLGLTLGRIGRIEPEPGLRLWRGELDTWPEDAPHTPVPNRWVSFDHFKA